MFLRKSAIKKLCKAAFKCEGLTVARSDEEHEDGYYIAGSYWKAWFKKDQMPKEVMAVIIELTGEIPERGKAYRAKESGNQYEIADTLNPNLYTLWGKFEKELRITTLVQFQHSIPIRFLQANKDNEIVAINEKFVEMIDVREIDSENGEIAPTGPFKTLAGGVMWGNNTSYLYVVPRVHQRDNEGEELTEEIELWRYLEGIDLF